MYRIFSDMTGLDEDMSLITWLLGTRRRVTWPIKYWCGFVKEKHKKQPVQALILLPSGRKLSDWIHIRIKGTVQNQNKNNELHCFLATNWRSLTNVQTFGITYGTLIFGSRPAKDNKTQNFFRIGASLNTLFSLRFDRRKI